MKVSHQKNVYYVDVNKNIYSGYVETSLTREINEKFIVYKSIHLEIEEVTIVDSMERLSFEYFNTKLSKEKIKTSKNPKIVIKPRQNTHTGDCEKYSDEKASSHFSDEVSFESHFSSTINKCFDAFRVKISDEISELNLKIRVVFKPTDQNTSILWYKPVSDKDKHKEVIACNQYSNSSSIAPYVDSICEIDLYYIIPNTEEVKVVSSGVFRSIKEEDKTIIYLYGAHIHPRYLSFSVGTYDQCDVFNDNDKRKLLLPYSIETNKTEVLNDLQAIIKYIESFTKTTELSTCNIIFSLIPIDNIVAKNIIMLKYNYIPSSKDIEMAYLLKRILSECFSQQVYHFMNWNVYDAWIYIGFSGYLADNCIRYLLGNNEFMFNYMEDRQYVIDGDVTEYPLFYTSRKEHECYSEFFRKKSRLVFHSMESHLSFAFLQKISDEIIELRNSEDMNRDSSSMLSELRRCFTPKFIKVVKDSTGKDLKAFFDFYVFRPGLLKIKLGFNVNKKKNTFRVTVAYTHTSMLPGSNKKPLGNINIKSVELEGNFDHEVTLDGENTFIYHTRTKKRKKEEIEDEEVMSLLYVRVDPKKENIFEYIVEQPDYMHIEQLQDKSVIGQLEAVKGLKNKPTLTSCEALEKMLDNNHVFYKVRIKVAYILKSINIEEYNGFQRTIQYFIRNRCVPNSTVLRSNEFGLIPYFIQKHLVKSISTIDLNSPNLHSESKIVVAFLENILKFNDNSLSQFEDSWYIAATINLFSHQSVFITCYKSPMSEAERAIIQYNDETDAFLSSSTKSEKSKPVLDHAVIIEKCIDELERFRISDMVFPSNNNIITRTCLISYIRLCFYNKISVSRNALENLSKYPNLYSIRLPAIEGLLILFSDSLPFILNIAYSDTSFITQKILEIIVNVMMLDLRVHFVDTDEYEVDLTENLRKQIHRNEKVLSDIYAKNFMNIKISDLLKKVFYISRNKVIKVPFTDTLISRYDFAKEEMNRQAILKIPSTGKRIRLTSMESLRIAAFEESMILRLPRIKNLKPKLQREIQQRNMKIRIHTSRFLVKYKNEHIIRFKIKKGTVKKSDLSIILIKKFCETNLHKVIDEYITHSKFTGFFPWNPHTSSQILNIVREDNPPIDVIFRELERSLIFVLSYNLMMSKPYQTAKMLYNRIEHLYLHNAFIREKVSPMTSTLRKSCEEFLNTVRNDIKYSVFSYPVDTTELKNYVDIVRVPVSFYDVYLNLPNYQSVDAFNTHLERIYINCLNYNDYKSEIAHLALDLKSEIDKFKETLQLECIDSKEQIKAIFESYNTENLLDGVIEKIDEIRTWGEIEDELMILKKKFTRSSHNGKILVSAVKNIREDLKNWFLFDGVRALV